MLSTALQEENHVISADTPFGTVWVSKPNCTTSQGCKIFLTSYETGQGLS